MSNVRILGLTGPVQNGKIQLAPVFKECGWEFIDLNDVIYDSRVVGTSEYERLQALMPGCIDDEGVETATFYNQVTPVLYEALLSGYMPNVQNAALAACAKEGRLVLSWEYLARIA